MTFEKEYLLKLDLQLFADAIDGDEDNPDIDLSGDGELDLQNAIKSLLGSEDDEDEDSNTDDDTDDNESDDDIDDEDDSDEDDEELKDEDDDEDEDPQPKKKQSKEDNAKFARERREREAQARAQAELDKLKESAPEFQLAKMLSEQFGKPVEDIMADIREEQIKQQAKATGRNVDDIRREQAQADKVTQLENELNIMKFNQWDSQIKADGAKLMSEYAMLTQEDMDTAREYILENNINMPLEDAIYAVHGKKIVDALAKGKQQDELAKESGRKKKTPPSPNNSRSKKVTTLSADEQAIARAFDMTDDEYNKFK